MSCQEWNETKAVPSRQSDRHGCIQPKEHNEISLQYPPIYSDDDCWNDDNDDDNDDSAENNKNEINRSTNYKEQLDKKKHNTNHDHLFDDGASSDDDNPYDELEDDNSEVTPETVIETLEKFFLTCFLEPLAENDDNDENPAVPHIDTEERKLSFHNTMQCRNLTSIFLVACFCHRLLLARRTATIREVYYYHATHFKHQRECDKAIWDLARILQLPSRQSLGVIASPKGWFCGCIDLYNAHTGKLVLNGRELDVHGVPITPATYGTSSNFIVDRGKKLGTSQKNLCNNMSDKDDSRTQGEPRLRIESEAKCILVIEKEGVYARLSEDKFFIKYYPCILVTGKGFPDVATRRWVHRLQHLLKIPALGLCDCNPYGISVLNTYQYEQGVQLEKCQQKKKKTATASKSSESQTRDKKKEQSKKVRSRLPLQIQWIGLRPSQVDELDLPPTVFQKLSRWDKQRLASLLEECHPFAQQGWNPQQRMKELKSMKRYKVELESLHWKGMNFLCKFVHGIIKAQEETENDLEPPLFIV